MRSSEFGVIPRVPPPPHGPVGADRLHRRPWRDVLRVISWLYPLFPCSGARLFLTFVGPQNPGLIFRGGLKPASTTTWAGSRGQAAAGICCAFFAPDILALNSDVGGVCVVGHVVVCYLGGLKIWRRAGSLGDIRVHAPTKFGAGLGSFRSAGILRTLACPYKARGITQVCVSGAFAFESAAVPRSDCNGFSKATRIFYFPVIYRRLGPLLGHFWTWRRVASRFVLSKLKKSVESSRIFDPRAPFEPSCGACFDEATRFDFGLLLCALDGSELLCSGIGEILRKRPVWRRDSPR